MVWGPLSSPFPQSFSRVGFDVFQKPAVALLPKIGNGIPCPAWNVLELSLALGVKPALGAILALDGDPLTKPVIINRVGRWDHRAGQLSTTWPSRTWTLIHCRRVRHQGSSIRFAAAGRNHLGRQTQP